MKFPVAADAAIRSVPHIICPCGGGATRRRRESPELQAGGQIFLKAVFGKKQ